MSTTGGTLGGILGAVAGFILSGGNPAMALYGAQLGIMAGSLIDPPKTQGPRLSDLTVRHQLMAHQFRAFTERLRSTVMFSGLKITL